MIRADPTSRPAHGVRDLASMYDVIVDSPGEALHVADLPWRLSSPSARTPERTRLWESADGRMLAWAVLQFQWHCLDYQIRPGDRSTELEASILSWATERLSVEAASRESRCPFTPAPARATAPAVKPFSVPAFGPTIGHTSIWSVTWATQSPTPNHLKASTYVLWPMRERSRRTSLPTVPPSAPRT